MSNLDVGSCEQITCVLAVRNVSAQVGKKNEGKPFDAAELEYYMHTSCDINKSLRQYHFV